MAVQQNSWIDPLPVKGVRLGVASSGIKYANRKDTSVMLFDEGTHVAGVFTRNAFAAAPVLVCRDVLSQRHDVRALVINSGNANACTGDSGIAHARQSCARVAELLGVDTLQVLPFSTGVIGEPLPIDKLLNGIPRAIDNASASTEASEQQWRDFAAAIMTTDTRPKAASVRIALDGVSVTVSGVAKGSGMIKPNMATMLGYIATDAAVAPAVLHELSYKAAQKSFNRITIDGDTSTNDSCILAATGKAGAPLIGAVNDAHYATLEAAVLQVYQALAKQIVEDGEGATKFVEIQVSGGHSAEESLAVAYAIAHSPLVKTAMAASDPNWGRIVAAIGYAGVTGLDPSRVNVWLDDVLIVENGAKAASYREELGQRVFKQESFCVKVALGRGSASETLWTSDLTHEYVRINADYRS